MVAMQSSVSASPVRTFSIGFREAGFSELPYARQVAEQYGTIHTEEVITPEAVGVLDDLVMPLRRAVRRRLGGAHAVGITAGAAEREGGDLRRWRRRGLRRLPPLRPRPV